MDTFNHPEPEPPSDLLLSTAAALDDVRRHLDQAQSAATTALAWVRLQQMHISDQEGNQS